MAETLVNSFTTVFNGSLDINAGAGSKVALTVPIPTGYVGKSARFRVGNQVSSEIILFDLTSVGEITVITRQVEDSDRFAKQTWAAGTPAVAVLTDGGLSKILQDEAPAPDLSDYARIDVSNIFSTGNTFQGTTFFDSIGANGDISAVGTFNGDGSGLGNLNASALSSGIVDEDLLPGGIAWLSKVQTFLAEQIITPSAKTSIALIARGVASQTADVFRVQLSDGTNLLRVTANDGRSEFYPSGISFIKPGTHEENAGRITYNVFGTNLALIGAGGGTSGQAQRRVQIYDALMVGASPAWVVGDGYIICSNFESQNPSGDNRFYGKINAGSNNKADAVIHARAQEVAVPALIAQGFAGQTSNIMEVRNSGGTAIVSVAPLGTMSASGYAEITAAKTGAYTLTDGDGTILANANSAAFAVTLPTAVGRSGRRFTVKKTDATANAVTITPTGGQTIDGAATYPITVQYVSITVVSDGTNWWII